MDTGDPYGFAVALGEPSLPVSDVGWDEIEGALGMRLPAGYKAWADRYRSLRFAEYLEITNLRCVLELESLEGLSAWFGDSTVSQTLAYQSGERLHAVKGGYFPYRAGEIRAYPEDGGLLQVGLGDNNEIFCLLPPPSPAEGWRVLATDFRVWWLYDGPFEDFLIALVNGHLDCSLLPDFSAEPVTVEERESYTVLSTGGYFTNWRPILP
ncbi:hypothetical protein AB0I28_32265 [Phytomonospora sp. NPDC050363]|uniref:hypothetical protein n=1 Tax=Phytomonospora sp. NPDC050363 TaxID=3155642 RepID=UPI0033FB4806